MSVGKDGIVQHHGDPKVSYATMMYIRQRLVKTSVDNVAKGLTIAIRYGIVRTQFKTLQSGEERKILDYQAHQYRITCIMARVFAYCFASYEVTAFSNEMQAKVDQVS